MENPSSMAARNLTQGPGDVARERPKPHNRGPFSEPLA
jgi:hypothetical protein